MRIVIDLQGAQTESRYRGIGRYSLSLAKAIARNRRSHEVIIVLSDLFPETIDPIRAEFRNVLPEDAVRVWSTIKPVHAIDGNNRVRREAAEIVREAFLQSLNPDIIHISSIFEGYSDDAVSSIASFDSKTPVSVTMYDLIPLLNAEDYLTPNPIYRDFYLQKIEHLKRADLLTAISAHSKQEAINALAFKESAVVNISTACDENFRDINIEKIERDSLLEKFGLNSTFVLYTGGADRRKNLPRLIQAFASLEPSIRNSVQLVLAGKMPDANLQELRLVASKAGLSSNEIVFTGYVDDDELNALYNLCHLYVFPSWHEGFGLPALEAMSCGAVVIGSNTASLPEVIGNEAALFDPYCQQAISAALRAGISDENFRREQRQYGAQQATKFSWDRCATTAVDAFEQFDRNRKPNVGSGTVYKTAPLIQALTGLETEKLKFNELEKLANEIASNHPQYGTPRMFVDVSELAHRDAATGVQRVTRNVVKELVQTPPPRYVIEPVYATISEIGYRYAKVLKSKIEGFKGYSAPETKIEFYANDIFLGVDLQHDVVIKQSSYFDQMRESGVAVYFVIYDLLPITLPHHFSELMEDLHKRWLEVVSRADGLICISNTVADEVRAWLRSNYPERLESTTISSFDMGADIAKSTEAEPLTPDIEELLSKLESNHTFLVVGTLEPRKSQAQVLQAFEQLWELNKDVYLVFAGRAGWMVDELVERIQSHPELGRRLHWFDGVSDQQLAHLYEASSCLIAASEGEGFGLPIIEAAMKQTPVIARDIPIFREVTRDSATYFSGSEPSAIATAVATWIEHDQKDNEFRQLTKQIGTWSQSVKSLLDNVSMSTLKQKPTQLMVDVSELAQRDAKSGIQRVVRNYLKELLNRVGPDLRVEPVYSTDGTGYRYARNFTARFTGREGTDAYEDYVDFNPGDIFIGMDLQPELTVDNSYFLQRMRRRSVNVRFFVYDILSITKPHFFPQGAQSAFTKWMDAVSQTDGLICISESVASEVRDWLSEHHPKRAEHITIDWLHLGADVLNSPASFGMPKDSGAIIQQISKSVSFLSVGTIEPRKGYAQTLDAFDLLWSQGKNVCLVMVGKQGWHVDSLVKRVENHPALGKRLFWLRNASDEFLEKLYSGSDCLLSASEGEGFGLPLIEAAQHGLPIITRKTSVSFEVAGDHAFYFEGMSGSELAERVINWLDLYQENEHPASDSMPWLTWKESTDELLSIIMN